MFTLGVRARAWLWRVGLVVAVVYVLTFGHLALADNALGETASKIVGALVWAIGIAVAIIGFLDLSERAREGIAGAAIKAINALRWRIVIIVICIAAGSVFLVLWVKRPTHRTWTCNVTGEANGAPDAVRCGAGSFATMRSFRLVLARDADTADVPVIHAQVVHSKTSVSVDSRMGGLCATSGPNFPTHGASELELVGDCGADHHYEVDVHVCGSVMSPATKNRAADLHAAVVLQMREEKHGPMSIECE